MELKAQISAITGQAKETTDAETETSAEGGGPLVTDADIANIVAQWTGIPVEKVRCLHLLPKCEALLSMLPASSCQRSDVKQPMHALLSCCLGCTEAEDCLCLSKTGKQPAARGRHLHQTGLLAYSKG
jgi:hypothetical protein